MLELNDKVMEIVKSYPTDGTHQYHWENGFAGVTKDLVYKDVCVAKSEPLRRTYCCGLTFEVYFRAAMAAGINLGTVEDVKRLRAQWFIATSDLTGPLGGLESKNLGRKILLSPKPGDFVQLWRKKIGVTPKVAGKYTSGHSVIFISEIEDGIKYWSTQGVTNGIGYREEKFVGNNPIVDLFIVRALK